MKNPNPNMLLRIAQADACAAAVEYIKPHGRKKDKLAYDRAMEFECYVRHPRHGMRAGQYTDDTQMSIGCSEVLLEPNYMRSDFAHAWVRCFKRDERNGYARGFQKFLEGIKDGDEFLAKIVPVSEKNGAAMRSVPFGVYAKWEDALRHATNQAELTHDTPVGKYGAQAVALMSHFAMHTDQPWEDMPLFVKNRLPSDIQGLWPYPDGVDPKRHWNGAVTSTSKTIHAIATLLLTKTSLKDMLLQAMQWGGDTDSVAAPCWGIASARYSGKTLPDWMYWGLEPGGQYGPVFLEELGQKLMKQYA